MRIRSLGYSPGTTPTGPTNSVLDVPGVAISQVTVPTSVEAEEVARKSGKPGPKKGLTVILPRGKDKVYFPCSAGYHIFNGNGELTGRGQIRDWGYVNTPIVLTNSCSLGVCYDGAQDFIYEVQDQHGQNMLGKSRNYGTPVIGETADWWINGDLQATRISKEDVRRCFSEVKTREEGAEVQEGSYGGGAGMTCSEYKGGTGTSSRVVDGKYTVGVLVQTNFGHRPDLQIGGVPIGKILLKERGDNTRRSANPNASAGRTDAGSLLVTIFTDAPFQSHQLDKIARHATAGVAQVGTYGIGRTHSGDIFLAVSTADHGSELLEGEGYKIGKTTQTYQTDVIKNESIDAYYVAVAEATEEAILNSMVGARDGMATLSGAFVEGLPVERVKELLVQYRVLV